MSVIVKRENDDLILVNDKILRQNSDGDWLATEQLTAAETRAFYEYLNSLNPSEKFQIKLKVGKKRIRLLEFSETLQATLLKIISDDNNKDVVRVTVYGYTSDDDHIQFSYDLPFSNEIDRDLLFDEITTELMFEDVKKLITNNNLPFVI